MNFQNLTRINKKTQIIFVTALIAIAALMVTNFRALYGVSRENIVYQGKENAIKSAQEFNNYLLTSINATELVAYTIDHLLEENTDPEQIKSFLVYETQNYENAISENYTGIYGYINGLYLDGTGWVPDESYDPLSRPWYIDAVAANGEIALITPYVDAETDTIMMTVSKMLSDKESVVAMDLTLNRIQEITDEIYDESGNVSYVMVIDDSGKVVAMSGRDNETSNETLDLDKMAETVINANKSSKGETTEIVFSGTRYQVYSEPIRSGWYAISVIDEKYMFNPLRTLEIVSLFVVVVVLIGVIVVFLSMNKRQIKSEDLNVRLQSIASIYDAVYLADLEKDTYEYISGQTNRSMKESEWDYGAADDLLSVAGWLSDEQTRSEFKKFVNLRTVAERMEDSDTITTEFLDFKNRWCRGRFVVAERNGENEICKVLFMVEIIDKEHRQRDALLYLSETDRMTGINNRGSGESKITQLLKNGEGGMFILLDVDHFKSVNDNYGHGVGDKVIIAIAKALKNSFRENDVVLRLGGDEFAAFAPGICDQEFGEPVIEYLISCISNIAIEEMPNSKIEVSIGAALYQTEDTFSFEDLYKRADRCTYYSKKRQGSCVTYYDGE